MTTDDGGLRLDDLPDSGRTPAPVWQRALLGLVVLAYLVIGARGAVLVIGEVFDRVGENALRLTGDAPTSSGQEFRADVLALTWRAVCVAGIGLVLGFWWRRRAAVWSAVAGILAALVVGLGVYWIAGPHEPARPSWENQPWYCQEHSGGDNVCPGD